LYVLPRHVAQRSVFSSGNRARALTRAELSCRTGRGHIVSGFLRRAQSHSLSDKPPSPQARHGSQQAAMAEAVRGLSDADFADLAYCLARFRR